MSKDDWNYIADVLSDCIVFSAHRCYKNYPSTESGMALWEVQNAIRSGNMALIREKHDALKKFTAEQHNGV